MWGRGLLWLPLLGCLLPATPKCPAYSPGNATGPTLPPSERTAMVWVSLSDYDATKANATLQVLRDNRRAYTHVALCAYNINGSQDGSFDPARSFVPIDDAQCSQCRRAMLELAAEPALQLQPLIGDPPWGHRTAWYERLFAEPDHFIAAAVAEAVRMNHSGETPLHLHPAPHHTHTHTAAPSPSPAPTFTHTPS